MPDNATGKESVFCAPGKGHELTCKVAPWRMMDSLTRTPAPIVTPVPMDTFGPI